MNNLQQNLDKAGVAHWDATERNVDIALEAFEPLPGIRGSARRAWHEMLSSYLKNGAGTQSLLELGCGGSALLPYFARFHGYRVSGIDYSEGGVRLAKAMCAANGVDASILQEDFFKAPSDLKGSFDVVVSFGVVEHFTDTPATIKAFSEFVRPGGTLISVVPNMQGLCGTGQRVLDRQVYDMHETIDVERLEQAHRQAGMDVVFCDYFMFANFGVINPGIAPSPLKRFAFQAMRAATFAIWSIESLIGKQSANRITSPYVVCIARRDGKSVQNLA